MYYRSYYQSPLGNISLIASDYGLCGLYFVGQKYFELGFEGLEIVEQEISILRQAKDWLDSYFVGEIPEQNEFPLAPQGTDFQRKVWQALLAIPYGQIKTYGQLAEELNCRSAQAVGSAVGKNPLSIIVPCHRVLGSTGSLTGYAGGLERKRQLLELEKNYDFL